MTHDNINLEIATPKGLFRRAFAKTTKIVEVIAAVVQAMGLDGGDTLELVHQGQVLQPVQRTLISFGFAGTVQLELVATGSGV